MGSLKELKWVTVIYISVNVIKGFSVIRECNYYSNVLVINNIIYNI